MPKLIAVRNILAEPERFGLKLDKFDNRPYFVAVSTGKHMDLDVAAKLAEMPMDEFKALNPAFNRPIYAHKPGRQLLIPATKAELFEKNLAAYQAPLLSWQVYTAQPGDSVEELAQRYGMTLERLRSVNGLAGNAIAPGQPLVLAALNPAATSATPSASTLTISADTDTTPDTLASPAPVARLAAATPVTLAASAAQEGANTPARAAASETRPPVAVVGDSAERADAPRRVLTTLAAQTASSPDSNVSRHTVAAGDTLYNIARRYNLSVAELKTLNRLDDEAIKLGQTLTVKGNASSAVASAKQASKPEPRETRKEYVVQKGDTLFSIARKFNIDHDDLKKWNQTKALARLQPGFKLTLWTGGR